MPYDPILPEVLSEQLKTLNRKLDEVLTRQEKANGSLGLHEKWISGKDVELEQIQDRLDADDERHRDIDRALAAHQSFIDQRANALAEHNRMKEMLQGMADYPTIRIKVEEHSNQLATHQGIRRAVAEWSMIVSPIIATLLLIYFTMIHKG